MSNFNDFLGMQAAKLNMTREEYTAYYLSESKPGPKPYHRGLGDDEIKDKKEQIKKQSDMSDDNSAAYKEMPGDKEARDKGEVKTSKHVKKYHELYGDKKDESVVTEGKIKYSKGKTYQSDGHWTVYVDSNSSGFDIRVNHSAGWRLDPQDEREETIQLLDNGRQKATLNFKSGNIDKFAQEMFDLNDRTTNGNQTKLTAKDYADIIRVWIDMRMANESVVNEDFPGKGETVKAKDLNHEMLDYFNRMNISLSINTKSKKNIKGSVGTMFNDLVFNGGDIDKKDIVSVKIIESVVNEAKAYKLKASEFGGDTHSAAYNVKGETTWRVHSTYAIDQVSGENNPEERDVVFFEAMPINNDIYIKIGGINNLKRTNGATVGNNFGTTIDEWKIDSNGIAKEASEFLTDATHLKWINKKARSEGQTIKWALKDDYSSVIEDLVNKSLGLSESVINEAAYEKATQNELAQYIINLSNELKYAKANKDKKEIKFLEKDIAEVKDALARKKNESVVTEGSEKETAKEIFYELMDVNGEEIADMDSQEAMAILSRRGIRGGKANKIAKELLKLTSAINEAKIWMVNEWGSSDQSNFNKSMHKEMGSPRKMPSPFDDKLRDVAADNVDHYWDDWDEYDTDRDGLIDNAVRHYLRAFFKKDFEMMQKMFASNNITEGMSKSAIKKAIKVIDKQIDTETGGDGEALDNETLQALEQERERLQAMNESKFSPLGYAKRVISGEITLKDAMKEAGISLSNISKLIKKLDKTFDVDSAVLAESRVNEKAEGDRGPISDPKIEKALKTKSEETGVPIDIIRIVMRRGMAAWKTGHRPGATEQQWGYARVNAFLTKGKGTWGDADKDVAKEVRDEGHDGGLKEHFDQSYRTI